MSEIETGGPAFPHDRDAQYNERSGMTLRDYFAAKAMQAYLSGPDRDSFAYAEWANASYGAADAMLKARE